nr:MAG TPA: hypothetical protein [Caudoviricetes sp.]
MLPIYLQKEFCRCPNNRINIFSFHACPCKQNNRHIMCRLSFHRHYICQHWEGFVHNIECLSFLFCYHLSIYYSLFFYF